MTLNSSIEGAAPAGDDTIAGGVADDTVSQDVTADSSTAADTGTEAAVAPKSTLEAGMAAIKNGKRAAPAQATAGDPAQAGDGAVPDPAAAEDVPPPFHEHPRWKAVIAERDEARGKITAVEKERDTYKQGHESFQQLHGFMTQAQLAPEEVNTGFEIMRLIKQEPEKALAALVPYVQALQQITGRVLPADLQEKVANGLLDKESAAELARSRATGRTAQQAAEAARAETERTRYETHVGNVTASIEKWESDWKTSDPDFKFKLPRVMALIENDVLRNGFPKTTKEAVDRAKKCQEVVNKEMSAFLPRRTGTKQIAATTGAKGGAATTEPKSVLDIIARVAGPARG